MIQSALQHLLLPSVVIFLFLGSVFAIVVGAGLILRGEAMSRLFGNLNRWVSTQDALKTSINCTTSNGRCITRTVSRPLCSGAGALSFIVLVAKYDVAVLTSVFAPDFRPLRLDLQPQS